MANSSSTAAKLEARAIKLAGGWNEGFADRFSGRNPQQDSFAPGTESEESEMRDKTQSSGSERGFAAMDEAKQRAIARKGGESVPPEKRSFSQDHALASTAGRKGGQSVAAEDRSFSRDRNLAAEAGRKGGQESGGGRSQNRASGGRDDDNR